MYGIEVQPTGDPYIEIAEKATKTIAKAGIPGTFLVDILPIRASLIIHSAREIQISLFDSEICTRVDARGGLS
jgi:hypothetical protein